MRYFKFNNSYSSDVVYRDRVYRVKDNYTWWFYSKYRGWVAPGFLKKWSEYSFTPNMVEITEKEAFIEIL